MSKLVAKPMEEQRESPPPPPASSSYFSYSTSYSCSYSIISLHLLLLLIKSGNKTWVLVLLASLFLLLILPSSLRAGGSSRLLVKNGWDALNLALVLFAIPCGLLGRNSSSATAGDAKSLIFPRSPYGKSDDLRPPDAEQQLLPGSPPAGVGVGPGGEPVGLQRRHRALLPEPVAGDPQPLETGIFQDDPGGYVAAYQDLSEISGSFPAKHGLFTRI